MVKVFVNAGHGFHDSGACNSSLGLQERYISATIAQSICNKLQNMGITTQYYQEVNKLSEVITEANKSKSDLFISIHLNAAINPKASGVETLYCEGSKEGAKFAQYIQDSIISIGNYTFKDRGIKDDSNKHLGVLRQTNMTACLVEMGFISNNTEAEFVNTHTSQCANAIYSGIIKYLKNTGKIDTDTQTSETKPVLAIIPIGKDLFNLTLDNKIILKENKLNTVYKYLKEKYSKFVL